MGEEGQLKTLASGQLQCLASGQLRCIGAAVYAAELRLRTVHLPDFQFEEILPRRLNPEAGVIVKWEHFGPAAIFGFRRLDDGTWQFGFEGRVFWTSPYTTGWIDYTAIFWDSATGEIYSTADLVPEGWSGPPDQFENVETYSL